MLEKTEILENLRENTGCDWISLLFSKISILDDIVNRTVWKKLIILLQTDSFKSFAVFFVAAYFQDRSSK